MRSLIIVLVFVATTLGCEKKVRTAYFENGQEIPKSYAWVNDFEDIYTTSEEKQLNTLLNNFEEATGYEVAIATLDTGMVGVLEDDMFNATFAMASFWGIGKAELDNGVLIGISRGRRRVFIQNGKGTEKVMSDIQTKKFIDDVFIPNFKQRQYFEGTLKGTQAILDFLRDKKIPTN